MQRLLLRRRVCFLARGCFIARGCFLGGARERMHMQWKAGQTTQPAQHSKKQSRRVTDSARRGCSCVAVERPGNSTAPSRGCNEEEEEEEEEEEKKSGSTRVSAGAHCGCTCTLGPLCGTSATAPRGGREACPATRSSRSRRRLICAEPAAVGDGQTPL
ncbi:unnamed protein product [Prorocentrum cordatum]|uniref:Secreted protein n=1 Tax=Prorocentrum cordatum TaxID=2364126 RepID=A0ABN9UY22_9DINO|nr:unnamed protein product [Polarella glacialis]